MDKILISACLIGHPVRYDGTARTSTHSLLSAWQKDGCIVPICPEIMAGLATPRPPAEIKNGATSQDVLDRTARIAEIDGGDLTENFLDGARRTLEIARAHKCRLAILTDGSPSCGSSFIYDGTFSGRKIAGFGVVAALLTLNGIRVFSESEIALAAEMLAA